MEMEMEIEGENGSKILVEEKMDLGRGLGFDSADRRVSRRHVSFKKLNQTQSLCFQVIGKNPIWVRTSNEVIRVYKSTQQGELKAGDSFCVSSKNPLWFHLKGIACQPQIHLNNQIDPVKEFSFVVMGHEFDSYPIPRHIRNWNWFLQQPSNEDSDDIKSRSKRKKGGKKDNDDDDDDDDVWTGESEDDVEVMKKKLRNDPKPKYSTRSIDKNKNNRNGATKSAKDDAKSDDDDDDDEEDEDEGDDTLGGFLVDDEDIGEGNEEEEDDEEEEFEEDVDEDDDDDE